ncbi:hypothetical protein AeRB84_006411 [Aphanomyces euteiches]|nr:hypothetical protein AeRB84_006411 [Aphanomyces euteiches]
MLHDNRSFESFLRSFYPQTQFEASLASTLISHFSTKYNMDMELTFDSIEVTVDIQPKDTDDFMDGLPVHVNKDGTKYPLHQVETGMAPVKLDLNAIDINTANTQNI